MYDVRIEMSKDMIFEVQVNPVSGKNIKFSNGLRFITEKLLWQQNFNKKYFLIDKLLLY